MSCFQRMCKIGLIAIFTRGYPELCVVHDLADLFYSVTTLEGLVHKYLSMAAVAGRLNIKDWLNDNLLNLFLKNQSINRNTYDIILWGGDISNCKTI